MKIDIEYIEYIEENLLFDYINTLYARNTFEDDTTEEIKEIYAKLPYLGNMKETYVQQKLKIADNKDLITDNKDLIADNKDLIKKTDKPTKKVLPQLIQTSTFKCNDKRCIKYNLVLHIPNKNFKPNIHKFSCYKYSNTSCFKLFTLQQYS
tara:strand:- start:193 stop:645 length:453 start_codon:yes stop_codon:yes gene_type:complete